MFEQQELTMIGQALRRHRYALRRRQRELTTFKAKLHQCGSALHYVQYEELTTDLDALNRDLQLLTTIEQKLGERHENDRQI